MLRDTRWQTQMQRHRCLHLTTFGIISIWPRRNEFLQFLGGILNVPFGLNICRLGPTRLCLQEPRKKKKNKSLFPQHHMAFFLWLIARVSGCAGKLILKYLMASHLGTFHLLFMQWLLFSFSVFYNPIRITSNLLTPETTANNDSGQKRRSACLGKLIPRILFSPTGRKTPDCFS